MPLSRSASLEWKDQSRGKTKRQKNRKCPSLSIQRASFFWCVHNWMIKLRAVKLCFLIAFAQRGNDVCIYVSRADEQFMKVGEWVRKKSVFFNLHAYLSLLFFPPVFHAALVEKPVDVRTFALSSSISSSSSSISSSTTMIFLDFSCRRTQRANSRQLVSGFFIQKSTFASKSFCFSFYPCQLFIKFFDPHVDRSKTTRSTTRNVRKVWNIAISLSDLICI